MPNVLFHQSDVDDPFAFYAHLLTENPIYFDAENNIWAVYSYDACLHLLSTESAHIPDPNIAIMDVLNPAAQTLAANLVRLQNPPRHDQTRSIVMRLVNQLSPVSTATLLDPVFAQQQYSFDWVTVVAKRLPALALLTGFDFSPAATDRLLTLLETLVKIMLPDKSAAVIDQLNADTTEAYALIESHIRNTPRLLVLAADDALPVIVANLIGLLIQSYDAGRGILSNALMAYLHMPAVPDYSLLIYEVLRHNPPVHNTRRLLTQPLTIGNVEIPLGAQVLIVMASANRDPVRFPNPHNFVPLRPNNREHLTFGAGAHACIAQHYISHLAAETLTYLAAHQPGLHLLTESITFEPLINARLPCTLQVTF